MSFGSNLQYLRRLKVGMTQESLAEKLNVSRQTISKWETDDAQPEIGKAMELCDIFSCTLDNLFREDIERPAGEYSNLRIETVPAFRYIKHEVISTTPEDDAIGCVRRIAAENGVAAAKVIGWDFPFVSPEQVNVHRMHGYAAAWILPEGFSPREQDAQNVLLQASHRYAAIHIERPFDKPFTTIPGAYRTLMDYMRLNGLEHTEKDVIPCFETDGETMDVYIACK